MIHKALDAFDSCHAPLPRATGSYSVVRTTQIVSGTEALRLFGPMDAGNEDYWGQTCCIKSVSPTGAINATNNASRELFTTLTSSAWTDARLTPSAFSVQIMNPEALQTSTGIVYIGRARQQLNPGGSTRTWNELAGDLVSYSSPRLCSAGKLALRGVQVDAVPYDMTALSDFRAMYTTDAAGAFTWTSDLSGMFGGFAPIFVYNPDGIDLQFLVCCEWRVRFDPSNPAYATHTYHTPSSLNYWDLVLRTTEMEGNGVYDISNGSSANGLSKGLGSLPAA